MVQWPFSREEEAVTKEYLGGLGRVVTTMSSLIEATSSYDELKELLADRLERATDGSIHEHASRLSEYRALIKTVLPFAERAGVPFESIKDTSWSNLRAAIPEARLIKERGDEEAMRELFDKARRLTNRELRRHMGRQRIERIRYTALEGESSGDEITLIAHLKRPQFERMRSLLEDAFEWIPS